MKKEQLPLVSIVTPSYNKGAFIEETIMSVRKQGYPRIEHIVVDGGSTDTTLEILRKHADGLIWISEPDKGQSDAINKGWRMTKGEILAYLNADDTYTPWAVDTAVKFLAEHPDVDMVYGECNIINEQGKVIGQYPAAEYDLDKMVHGNNMIPQPTVFFRRYVLDDVGYLDNNLNLAMDYDFWIRIALKFRVRHIPCLLGNFRSYPGTKSYDEPHKFTQEHLYILNKLYSTPALPRELRQARRKILSSAHLNLAREYRRRGHLWRTLIHSVNVLMLDPRYFLGVSLASIKSRHVIRQGKDNQ